MYCHLVVIHYENGFFQIMPIMCEFVVKPSSEVSAIEVFHSDPYADLEEASRVKTGKCVGFHVFYIRASQTGIS